MSDSRPLYGLPLLSGLPPTPTDSSRAELSCRKCNKEFNIIFTRQKRCNHCGYSYCSSCVDYQALMPRGGSESGYITMSVCAFCIEFLNITAAARGQLKTMPLSKLKRYVDAYNIKVDRAVEKDDLIDGIIAARCPNGCLSHTNEEYYRKYSIPDRSSTSRSRGLFGRAGGGSQYPPRPPAPSPPSRPPESDFPRPDLEPDHPMPPPPRSHYSPPPGPPPGERYPSRHNYRHTPPPSPPHRTSPPPRQRHQAPRPYYNHTPSPSPPPHRQPPPSQRHRSPPPPAHPFPSREPHLRRSSDNLDSMNIPRRTNSNAADSPRPRATSASPAPSSLSLDELLLMSPRAIAALPISTLKTILFTNHVNAGMILEKGELVLKVNTLVEEERRTRERQRLAEEQEAHEALERQREMLAEHEREKRQKEESENDYKERDLDDGIPVGSSDSKSIPPGAQKAAAADRTGLCVVCQDEEANIAIVDCGHLAMCRGCSDMIMASSRECPLCRTRIVTEARLLRIFKS